MPSRSLVETSILPCHLTSSTDFVSNPSSMTKRQRKGALKGQRYNVILRKEQQAKQTAI